MDWNSCNKHYLKLDWQIFHGIISSLLQSFIAMLGQEIGKKLYCSLSHTSNVFWQISISVGLDTDFNLSNIGGCKILEIMQYNY